MKLRVPTDLIIDQDKHTITFERVLAAPCEQVFAAWTLPEHVSVWWDPTGQPLAECEIDLRPGGGFRFASKHSTHAPPFEGVYHEIVPSYLLVFEALGAVGRVDFKADERGTLLTVSIACRSAAQLEQYLKMGVDTGTGQTLDNLVAYVNAPSPRQPTVLPSVSTPRR